MARLVISLLLASAAALDEQRLRGARSSDLEHRSGGRHASFGSITPRYDDLPLITCDGNPGKCISPDGAVEDFGEMQCNTVTEPFLVADPIATQEKLKCGPHNGPNDRTFKYTTDGGTFGVDACKNACAGDLNCKAMSLGFSSEGNSQDVYWCMGCSAELDKVEAQTVAAYKKAPYFCGGEPVSQDAVKDGFECEWTFCPGETVVVEDLDKNNIKCGEPSNQEDTNVLRSFKFSSDCPDSDDQCETEYYKASDAELCKAACLNDETCVAVSQGVHNSKEYCIGCKVPLWLKFADAKPYKKVKTTDL